MRELPEGYTVRELDADEAEAIGFDSTLRTTYGPAYLLCHPDDDPKSRPLMVEMTARVILTVDPKRRTDAGELDTDRAVTEVRILPGHVVTDTTDHRHADDVHALTGSWYFDPLAHLPEGVTWEG